MKTRLSIISIMVQIIFFCSDSFSQATNTCAVPNAGFENGNTTGWILKSGGYGVNPPCPTGSCPRYGTTYTGGAVPGPLNGPVNGAGNRHTIMSTAGGNDPNSVAPNLVPVVAPGGGTYSLRLGNSVAGGTTLAQAEAARLTFAVTNQNAYFTYRYSFFVGDGSHTLVEQPSFEVVVLDQNDSLIPCGRYFVVAGNNPGCVNSSGFITGSNGFVYKPWTDVGLDLTGYIGQNVSIEFRTSDCYPVGGGSSSTNCGTVCTLTNGSGSCTYNAGSPPCTPSGGSACSGSAGTHSAYAYIDAYCAPLNVPTPVFCAGASSVQICAPVGYSSYSWPAGQPGLSGSPTTQCVTINNPVAGTTYTVNMVSATGCPTSTKVTLKGFDLTLYDTTICTGSAPFPLRLTPSFPGNYNYSWSPSTGLSCTTCQSPTYTPSGSTGATYTVTMTDPVLGCSKTKSVTITIQQTTSVTAVGTTVCSGVSGTLTASGQSCSGGITYSWSPSTYLSGTTGSTVTAVNPTTTTTYTVTATNGSGQTATATALLTVNPNPVVTVPSDSICAGTSTTLTASGATNYIWSPSTGLSSSTGASVTASPTTTTTYTVTGSFVTGCTGTTTVTVTVNPNPVITVPGATICPGATASLTASGATTYTWSPASGLSSVTGTTVTASPTVTTTYTVIGTSATGGCTGSTTVVVTVLPPCGPGVNATGAVVCYGVCGTATATAFGGTPPYTYAWNTGETTASITPNPCPTVTTTYTITVTDTSVPVGSATATATITVDPAITLNVAPVNVTCFGACNGQTIVIPSGGNGSFTYSWSGGCTQAACNNVCAGSYTITATDGLGCIATGSTTVTEPSALTISNTSTNVSCFGVCDGTASVTANGGTPPYSYSWSPSGGAATNATSLCAGTYTCTVTDANSCTINTIVTITQPTQIVVTSANASICFGECTTLNSSSSGGTAPYTYSWSPASSTATSLSDCPVNTTVYTITTTDANGCTGGTSVTVTVHPLPVVNIPPATICEGTSATLTASGAYNYSWSPTTGLSSGVGASVVASPAVTTTYTVVGITSFGCTSTSTVTVTVNPAPVVTTTGGDACPGVPITLTAGGANTYTWAPPTSLNTTTGPTVISSPSATITYTVTGVGTNGCSSSTTVTAVVNPKPVAAFITTPNDANEFNPTIYFYDQSSGGPIVKWHWTLGDSANTPSTLQNPVFTYPPFAHTYPIKLVVVNQYGCIDSVTGTVIIHGIFTFYIPNTFTPNNDGVNDGFMPKGVGIDETDYDLWIFDRWGNLIWHTNIWGDAWDGRANHGANVAQIDTYVWKVHVKEKETGYKHNYIGHVNIVK